MHTNRNRPLEEVPKTYFGCKPPLDESIAIDYEIMYSWALIFNSTRQRKRATIVAEYHLIPHLAGVDMGSQRVFHLLLYEMDMLAPIRLNVVAYSKFPIFEARLRQLRHYMDNRKPHGLRALWHDKRDTLDFYTF